MLYFVVVLSTFQGCVFFVAALVIKNCQNCHYVIVKLWLGMLKVIMSHYQYCEIFVRDFQICRNGLSKLSLGIVKIVITDVQNCQ